ncbi:MAG: shikimate dehydrogenase [Pseudomonadota bacterium]
MTDLFDFSSQSKRFAVIGNPIAHSKSPQIHQAFARQFTLTIEYQRTQVDPGGFHQAVSHFAAHGGSGLNITVPFKLEAFDWCSRLPNQLTERAGAAGAVNTIKFNKDGTALGDNTDGVGMLRDIEQNAGVEVSGKSLLVIGAGGAVRGILQPLIEAGAGEVCIVNRTVQKARDLASLFSNDDCRILASSYAQLDKRPFDIIINGTSASLGGDLPPLHNECIAEHSLAYDMMYASRPTVFMAWASGHGAGKSLDGLGMLVEQAAESFYIWHDKKPVTAPVLEEIRQLN